MVMITLFLPLIKYFLFIHDSFIFFVSRLSIYKEVKKTKKEAHMPTTLASNAPPHKKKKKKIHEKKKKFKNFF